MMGNYQVRFRGRGTGGPPWIAWPLPDTSTVIDLPADRVWAAVRDFNGLATWWPAAVTNSEIEEGKGGDQVGAVRSFHLKDGAHLRERLLSHSDVERSYSYNFQ